MLKAQCNLATAGQKVYPPVDCLRCLIAANKAARSPVLGYKILKLCSHVTHILTTSDDIPYAFGAIREGEIIVMLHVTLPASSSPCCV